LDNVCINPKTLKIKIIDFGFANLCQNEDEITKIEASKGSPLFSAPEKFQLKKIDGRKSDVWSIGVMLYKFISSDFPFGKFATNWSDLIKSIRHEKLRYLDSHSHLLNDLLFQMLNKKPHKRPYAVYCLEHPWFRKIEILKKKKNSNCI
jgi:serine/threonine protein kinase